MSVKTYSKSADGGKKLSEHFEVKEFSCSDGDKVLIDTALVESRCSSCHNRFTNISLI